MLKQVLKAEYLWRGIFIRFIIIFVMVKVFVAVILSTVVVNILIKTSCGLHCTVYNIPSQVYRAEAEYFVTTKWDLTGKSCL